MYGSIYPGKLLKSGSFRPNLIQMTLELFTRHWACFPIAQFTLSEAYALQAHPLLFIQPNSFSILQTLKRKTCFKTQIYILSLMPYTT